MCKVFKVSKSSYYQWLRNGPSDRWKENESLLVDILGIFENSRKTYGSPRITEELRAQNRTVSRKRVAKIMQAAGIQARKRKKFKATTDSRHKYPIAPNVLDRNFSATRPGEIWVSDITYGVPGSQPLINGRDTSSFEIYSNVSMPCCEGI